MTLVVEVKERIHATVPALAGRVEEVADLAALVAEGALPQRSPAAFVIPLGIDAEVADTVVGMHRQPTSDTIGVVLTVEALGDPKARRALPKLDVLVESVIAAVAGWRPGGGAGGAFTLRRGVLVSVTAGLVIYQLDFSLPGQLRIA